MATTPPWDRIGEDYRAYLENCGYTAADFNNPSFNSAETFNAFNAYKQQKTQQLLPEDTVAALTLFAKEYTSKKKTIDLSDASFGSKRALLSMFFELPEKAATEDLMQKLSHSSRAKRLRSVDCTNPDNARTSANLGPQNPDGTGDSGGKQHGPALGSTPGDQAHASNNETGFTEHEGITVRVDNMDRGRRNSCACSHHNTTVRLRIS